MSRLLSKNDPRDAISKSIIGNFVLDTVARAIDKSEQQLEAMTRKWQSRDISNVSFLISFDCRKLMIVCIPATAKSTCESYTQRYVSSSDVAEWQMLLNIPSSLGFLRIILPSTWI